MTESAAFTNAARRLYELLQQARNLPNQPTIGVWAEVLDADVDTEQDVLFERFVQLRQLYADTQRAMHAIPNLNTNLFMRWVAPVEAVLTVKVFHLPWNDVRASLNDVAMQALEFSGEELSRHHEERRLTDSQLEEIEGAIVDLLERLMTGSVTLPFEIGGFLVCELTRLSEAIAEYRIRGAVVLRDAFEHSVGALLVRQTQVAAVAESDELRGFWRILWNVYQCTNFAFDIQQLAEGVVKLLPLLGGPSPAA